MHGLSTSWQRPDVLETVSNLPRAERVCAQANILGVGVSAISMRAALDLTMELLDGTGKGYICVSGVHGIMEAQRDPSLRRILNRAFLCTPDGMPTVWLGRLQGYRSMERVYGPDFMLQMCRESVSRNHRHFLYGGGPGVAEKLRDRLQSQVPGVNVVGTYTPPFRPLHRDEEHQLIAAVKRCRPDIIWVGLSTPKQERFMAQYLERLNPRLMIGVGAAFDIHTGKIRDSPQWVKRSGMQWIHRLLQEPRRLWRRYLVNNPLFLWNIAMQLAGVRRFEIER